MPKTNALSNTIAATEFLVAGNQEYAYRRFGSGSRPPLLCLQHFTGTLDNWDPAVTDVLAQRGEVILFGDSGGMAKHALESFTQQAKAFLASNSSFARTERTTFKYT